MGDQQHAVALAGAEPVDPLGHHLQRVDVQAGVGLVQDRDLRVEQLELQDLVPLLLPAGEALVQVPLRRTPGRWTASSIASRSSLRNVAQLRRLAADRGDRGAQEVGHRHPGHLDRVLHGQEQPGAGPRVHAHGQHVLAVQGDRALGDLVLGVAGDRVGEGGLARAVRPHDRVGLARRARSGRRRAGSPGCLRPARRRVHADVQVADLKGGHQKYLLVMVSIRQLAAVSVGMATYTSSPSIFTG